MVTSETPSEGDQGFYRVTQQETACTCDNCLMWTVSYHDGIEDVEIGQAWQGELGQETAQDVCDLMNMAFEAGKEAASNG